MVQFLQEFQNSMERLNLTNQKIQDNIKFKKEFSDNLVSKLKDINSKIKNLAFEINKLKESLDGLQGQVNSNSTFINDKDKQISDLTERINSLENEKQQNILQLAEFQNKKTEQQQIIQQKIDNYESQIRKLTEDNIALKNQSEALINELSSKGDTQSQHAEQLKKQTEEFQQQLANQEQANKQQIEKLIEQIHNSDIKISDLEKQLQDKTSEIENNTKRITDSQGKTQSQIDELNRQINDLKTQNEDLVQRIILATQAIIQATDNLEILANSVPDGETKKYVDQLFAEVEQSIENISGVIQGRALPSQSQQVIQPQQVRQINPDDMIVVSQIGGPSIQFAFKNILQGLQKKASQGGNVQKYKDALNQIKKAETTDDVTSILNRNNISFKNGAIMGGKKSKTKKNKKQKGGFTYKINTKRKSITSLSSSRERGRRFKI